MTIAIAYTPDPKKVAVWADVIRRNQDGSISFEVINGCWRGRLFADGTLRVNETKAIHPALKVWEGNVPEKHARDYNDAIAWIEKQL